MVALTVGTGLTITLTVVTDVQVPAEAVIVKVVVCWVFVVFDSVPEIEEPEPDEPIPVIFTLFVLVQENVVPATLFGFAMSI